MNWRSPHVIFYSLLAAITIVLGAVAVFTDGTAGFGDSICHYLIARGAWKNPVMFLDLWGKPVYTVLSAPFAHLGFTAAKLFNIIVMAVACAFTYHTALKLQLKYAAWVVLFFFFASETIEVTVSAFTEPVFALVLIAGLFYLSGKKPVAGTIILSFLPFARQEGLIILCVLAVYLLASRNYKAIPFMLVGHLVLGAAGWPVFHDFLWTIHQNPYSGKVDTSGVRNWDYFFVKMYYMFGPVTCYLLLAGLAALVYEFMLLLKTKADKSVFLSKSLLVGGSFTSVFTAHSIFWVTGMFASIGLTRVIIGVVPAIALLSLTGLNALFFLLEKLPVKRIKIFAGTALIFQIIHSTFFSTFTKINFRDDFYLNEGQAYMAYTVAPYVKSKFPTHEAYFSDMGLAFLLDQNFYDKSGKKLNFISPWYELKKNELIIWDDMHSKYGENILLDSLLNKPHLQLDTTLIQPLKNEDTLCFYIFTGK
ncbi:MAG: DUF2029 domain-containing protein [Bacteroidia bacterium]|nr:DUF2029 domain-containing protein [Bacteroidia bacterium]